MSHTLASNGANKIYILGRRKEVLETAAASYPDIITPIQADVTSKSDLQAAVEKITLETGYVNLVIANSGTIGPVVRFNPSPSTTVSDLRDTLFTGFNPLDMTDTLHVNVTAAFFTMTAFLELLDAGNKKAQEAGGFGGPVLGPAHAPVPTVQSQVIFTTSVSAFSRHWSSSPPYLASKVAVMQIAKYAIYPSELASSLIGNRKPEEEAFEDPRFIPARRFGGDEEMAGAILYLASRAGSYSNGSILLTDGGRLSVMTGTY
ncbi:hypothetical protein N8T08_000412 [Aspergillus melleus]|uniref:Uncharacterized protein n=1 Tax=Aspergillus melleus TaxID=138277 RepID=A0ACC3BBA0_9EURO|nr:hypothetical protein N8T08_000412 [Aspergillus melleus]